jgi:DNA polymerase-3 subunit gamma/tau
MALLRMLAFAPVSGRVQQEQETPPRKPVAVKSSAETPAASPRAEVHNGTNAVAAAEDAPWTEVIEQLGVTGMARMLAQHCELVKRDAKAIELKLPRAHERLLEKAYQERLKAALQKRYGPDVQVSIGVGEGTGNSPAEISDRERQRSQARAIAEIEQDPFVRDLVENFDARVNESSIKPIQ